MSDVDLQKLRDQFPAEVIGKLPRVTCPKCSQRGTTATNTRRRCARSAEVLHPEQHIHLDYVGHADVTIRLIGRGPGVDVGAEGHRPGPGDTEGRDRGG